MDHRPQMLRRDAYSKCGDWLAQTFPAANHKLQLTRAVAPRLCNSMAAARCIKLDCYWNWVVRLGLGSMFVIARKWCGSFQIYLKKQFMNSLIIRFLKKKEVRWRLIDCNGRCWLLQPVDKYLWQHRVKIRMRRLSNTRVSSSLPHRLLILPLHCKVIYEWVQHLHGSVLTQLLDLL